MPATNPTCSQVTRFQHPAENDPAASAGDWFESKASAMTRVIEGVPTGLRFAQSDIYCRRRSLYDDPVPQSGPEPTWSPHLMNPAGLGPTLWPPSTRRSLADSLHKSQLGSKPRDILRAALQTSRRHDQDWRLCPPALSCLNAFVCLSFSFFDHSRFQSGSAPAPIRWIVAAPGVLAGVFMQETQPVRLFSRFLWARKTCPQRHVWCRYGLIQEY